MCALPCWARCDVLALSNLEVRAFNALDPDPSFKKAAWPDWSQPTKSHESLVMRRARGPVVTGSCEVSALTKLALQKLASCAFTAQEQDTPFN
jgi:hypothetical protein